MPHLKTHLMQAIGNYICSTAPGKRVLYVTSEEFTHDVNEYIRKGQADELYEKYRKADVLLVDDVQFIIGNERPQLEFFNIFNTLHQERKQIVLSSDRPPKEMWALDEGFESSFGTGLIADIQKPEYETRKSILKRLHEGKELKIDDSVWDYISNNVISNVRDLEGAYTKIVIYSKLKKLDHVGEAEAELALSEDIEN